MSNLVAIIIPYYKITFLRETLDSLAAQTDQRFTVYIGNDASPDNPVHLLKEYEGKFNFVYKKFEENLGGLSLTKQWDRCIEMMQGEEWFMILGDDDYLGQIVVEELYRNIETSYHQNVSVIKFNSAIIDQHNNILSEKSTEPLLKSAIEHFFDKVIYEGRSSLSEHIFRKSGYEKYGFADFPFAWHSDDLALLEFSEFGNILFLEKAKCFVRISSESISGNPDRNKKEKWHASKLFFDRVCQNLEYFDKCQKKKLFDLVEWYETDKKIKINIPNKTSEFYNSYGWRGIIKAVR